MQSLWQPHFKLDDEEQNAAFYALSRKATLVTLRGPDIRHFEYNKEDSDVLCYALWQNGERFGAEVGLLRPKQVWVRGIPAILDQPATRVVYKDETDQVREVFGLLAAQGFHNA